LKSLGQKPPSPEELAQFNAKRVAKGLPELPPNLFEEVGLSIEEIPKEENPWGDPRYVTQVPLKDPKTGQMFYPKIERVHALDYRNKYIYTGGYLEGLADKAQMTAWTLWEKLLERCMFEETAHEGNREMMSDHSHLQAQLAEVAKALRQRLEKSRSEFTGLRELALTSPLREKLDGAVNALRELEQQAAKRYTVRAFDFWNKRLLATCWLFDRPAVAYAIHKLFEKHAARKFGDGEIYKRIAHFENRFLGHSIHVESGQSVARAIFRFKINKERMQLLDTLLGHLLTAEWYVWPPDASLGPEPPRVAKG